MISLGQCLHTVSTMCLPQSASCGPLSESRGNMEVSVEAPLVTHPTPGSRCWGVSNSKCGRVHLRVIFSNSHHLLLGMCGSTVILHPWDGDVPAGNLDSTRLSNISAEQRSRLKQKYLLSGLDQGLRASSVLIPHQPGMVLSPSELTGFVAGMGRLPRGHPEPHSLQQSFPQLCVQRDVRFACLCHSLKRL